MQEKGDGVRVNMSWKAFQGHQGLEFRSKEKGPWNKMIIYRFDSQPISCQEKALLPAIPQRQGKHAHESIETFYAPLNIGLQDDFRVGSGSKLMAASFQDLTDLFEIIHLAIVYYVNALIIT